MPQIRRATSHSRGAWTRVHPHCPAAGLEQLLNYSTQVHEVDDCQKERLLEISEAAHICKQANNYL